MKQRDYILGGREEMAKKPEVTHHHGGRTSEPDEDAINLYLEEGQVRDINFGNMRVTGRVLKHFSPICFILGSDNEIYMENTSKGTTILYGDHMRCAECGGIIIPKF